MFGEWREGLDLAVTMIPVLWDVDSRDWESQNTASICSAVLPNVKDGSIILMTATRRWKRCGGS